MHPLPQSAVNDCVIAMVELGRKRVYFRKGWHCQFLEEDMKTQLPRTLTPSPKIWEMAKRGGFHLEYRWATRD